jgi:hypothetical protein
MTIIAEKIRTKLIIKNKIKAKMSYSFFSTISISLFKAVLQV